MGGVSREGRVGWAGKRPGAKAPVVRGPVFVGLKPYANPKCAIPLPRLFWGMGLDVLAQGQVDVQGLFDAVVQHAEPVAAGVF